MYEVRNFLFSLFTYYSTFGITINNLKHCNTLHLKAVQFHRDNTKRQVLHHNLAIYRNRKTLQPSNDAKPNLRHVQLASNCALAKSSFTHCLPLSCHYLDKTMLLRDKNEVVCARQDDYS